ncbi:MAG: dipeptidase [Acidimicrobiales bacterium]
MHDLDEDLHGVSTPATLERARKLLAEHQLVDGHNDLAWAARQSFGYDLEALALHERRPRLHTDLPRLVEGGVGGQFWSVYVPSNLPAGEAVLATLEQIDFVHRLVARYPDRLALVRTADGLGRAFAAGRIASLLGAEGGHSIGGSLAVLRMLYDLGVRYLTLTHFDNVAWADSATDVPRCGGLAEFGREVVEEMNKFGMIVDLSHVSEETMSDALDASRAPVIFSHSSAGGLVAHPRNVPDAVLARMAVNGGVCMVAFVPEFVSVACHEWGIGLRSWMEQRGLDHRDELTFIAAAADYERLHARPRASVTDVADHVERVREVAGVDHVGLGADFDGCDRLADGLEDVSTYPRLFAELLDRGWSEPDCALLAGQNLHRTLRDVEGCAA